MHGSESSYIFLSYHPNPGGPGYGGGATHGRVVGNWGLLEKQASEANKQNKKSIYSRDRLTDKQAKKQEKQTFYERIPCLFSLLFVLFWFVCMFVCLFVLLVSLFVEEINVASQSWEIYKLN